MTRKKKYALLLLLLVAGVAAGLGAYFMQANKSMYCDLFVSSTQSPPVGTDITDKYTVVGYEMLQNGFGNNKYKICVEEK